MKPVIIKKEVNSDGEDNDQLPPEEIQTFSNDIGIKSEQDDFKEVKKEFKIFDGLPQTLQIQPLPDALTESARVENNFLENFLTSRINFREYCRFKKKIY